MILDEEIRSLLRNFSGHEIASTLAEQLDDPGIIVAALSGDTIWSVRYEVCFGYRVRRDKIRVLRRLRELAHTRIEWERRWPCRLVIYILASPLVVEEIFRALDAVSQPQAAVRVPPKRRSR